MLNAKSLRKFSSFKSHPWRIWLDESFGLTAKDVLDIVLSLETATSEIASSKYARVNACEQTVCKKKVKLYVKRYLHRGVTDKMKHVVRKDRASREAHGSSQLNESGFRTPRTIAWGFSRKAVFKESCFLMSQEIRGKKPLPEIIDSLQGPGSKTRLLEELAGTVAKMHKRGLFHGDMRARNIFTSRDQSRIEFCFLDNERTKQFSGMPESLRLRNLVQLDLFLVERMEAEQRRHFFQRYAEVVGIKDRDSLIKKVMYKTDNRVRRLVRLGRMIEK